MKVRYFYIRCCGSRVFARLIPQKSRPAGGLKTVSYTHLLSRIECLATNQKVGGSNPSRHASRLDLHANHALHFVESVLLSAFLMGIYFVNAHRRRQSNPQAKMRAGRRSRHDRQKADRLVFWLAVRGCIPCSHGMAALAWRHQWVATE